MAATGMLGIATNYSLITGSPHDYDNLMDLVGDARIVLIGEASHGTHEFYRERSRITKQLIVEKGFNAVAVEADWPDAAVAVGLGGGGLVGVVLAAAAVEGAEEDLHRRLAGVAGGLGLQLLEGRADVEVAVGIVAYGVGLSAEDRDS